MTLTAEQIAEIMYPINLHDGPITREKQMSKRKTLTSLIRDLQKQTWDQACKAQKKVDESYLEFEPKEYQNDFAPFNPEK